MSVRASEEPWGAARFAYSYLGVVVAILAAGLVAAVAYPIFQATPMCNAEEGGYCLPGVTGITGFVVFVGLLVLIGWLMRMGWEWALWVPVLTLVVAEIAVEANSFLLFLVLFLVPAGAAAGSFERPDRPTPRALRIVRLSILACALIQFVIWIILVVTA